MFFNGLIELYGINRFAGAGVDANPNGSLMEVGFAIRFARGKSHH